VCKYAISHCHKQGAEETDAGRNKSVFVVCAIMYKIFLALTRLSHCNASRLKRKDDEGP